MKMSPFTLVWMALFFLLSLATSIFMGYVALSHNPQQEFYTMEGGIIWRDFLPIPLGWFLLTFLVTAGIFFILKGLFWLFVRFKG